jgi:hypothetical protein
MYKRGHELYQTNNSLNEEILEEGIVFFKTSEKLNKVVDKLSKKAFLIENETERNEILKITARLNSLAVEFKKVENEYAAGKVSVKYNEHKELLKKYKDVLLILKKESVKNNLKKINSFGILVASIVFSFLILDKLPGGNFLTSIRNLFISMLPRIPLNFLGVKIDKKIDKINNEEEIIKSIKKIYPEFN